MKIDANGIHYKEVNDQVHAAIRAGERELVLENVRGQRYLAAGLEQGVSMTIKGVPGNDLASFMNGARIMVQGNAQDAVGNTMNRGKVVVHGVAGDILGYGMRGGRIFIKGDVGYRAGIHMKAYLENFPLVVVGGTAQDYLGEYMAGGVLVVLNLQDKPSPVGYYAGTGMHGGTIYVRGKVEPYQVGAEVGFDQASPEEWEFLKTLLGEYQQDLELPSHSFSRQEFIKLYPKSTRPYGNLYAY
ncbi:MAG: hypothetical protein PVG60_06475 [Desulfarculaceae bacterium]|jgi:glutamate synthase domain-containing protein 3